ncbi:hypothetical protein Hanom_Chr00s120011g01811191 [Helianthus anomalus]
MNLQLQNNHPLTLAKNHIPCFVACKINVLDYYKIENIYNYKIIADQIHKKMHQINCELKLINK